MFRRVQHQCTAPAEGEQQYPTRPQPLLRVTALAGSGLSGAALSWSLLGHSPLWTVAALAITATAAMVCALARHTPDLVHAVIWRLALRTELREVRQFAREDLLSEKITPQQLIELAGNVHRHTLKNQPPEPRTSHDNDH